MSSGIMQAGDTSVASSDPSAAGNGAPVAHAAVSTDRTGTGVDSTVAGATNWSPTPVEAEEFDYRPIPPLAAVGAFFGFLAGFAWMGWFGVGIAVIGVAISAMAWRQIASHRSEYSGGWIAAAGLFASLAFGVSGSAWHVYDYITELPEGYERVSFYWLSKQEPIVEEGEMKVAEDAKKLDGKNIWIKGYMYPMQERFNLSEFVLCRDNGDCCFGGRPKPTDMIIVRYSGRKRVNHRDQQLVGVGGKFVVEDVTGNFGSEDLSGIYRIEGTHFK